MDIVAERGEHVAGVIRDADLDTANCEMLRWPKVTREVLAKEVIAGDVYTGMHSFTNGEWQEAFDASAC